ncbi:MAG: MerR family transcriptional regulator [bacterium]|nr:MerR family transcriptional regulator [bacterium]
MFVYQEEYSVLDVERLTHIKRHCLAYYDRIGIFSPSITNAKRKRARRKYTLLDILVLQAVSELKLRGMAFNKIRKAIEYLRKHHGLEKPFHAALDGRHNVRILTDGLNAFYICFNDHEIIEHLKTGGQYMMFDVSDAAFDLKEKIMALHLYKRKQESEKFKQTDSSCINLAKWQSAQSL